MIAEQSSNPVLLYLHIPKCGGSTITHVLYEQCRSGNRDQKRHKYWHRGVYFYPAGLFSRPTSPLNPDVAQMLKREDLRAVAGHFAFGIHRHVPSPSIYITALRNPLTRILSLYDELTAQKRIQMTLEEFIHNPPFPELDNDQTRRIAGEDSDGESMLEKAKSNLKTNFAVAGLTERMDESLCLMHRLFGWERQVVYYPKNITLHRTKRESLPAEFLQVISDRNHLDFQLYEYSEKLFNEAIHKQGFDFPAYVARYKQSVRDLIDQTKMETLENAESRKTHQIVLDMMETGELR